MWFFYRLVFKKLATLTELKTMTLNEVFTLNAYLDQFDYIDYINSKQLDS